MRNLVTRELESVSGGTSILPMSNNNSDERNDELLKYKMGQPNLLGVNTDGTLPQPPFGQ